jgi:hypothetical protein
MSRGDWWTLALVITLGATAHADDVDEERVTTRDGTVVQGELVEKVPNVKIVIKLATGEVREIPWAEIVPNEPQKKPTQKSTAHAPNTSSHAAPQSTEPSGIAVEVTADSRGVSLQRVAGGGGGSFAWGTGVGTVTLDVYENICTAPCTAYVQPGTLYRIGGSSIMKSDEFTISKPMHLEVSAGSRAARFGGVFMLSTGLSLAGCGGLFLGLDVGKTSGIAMLSVGSLLTVIGIPLLVSSVTSVKSNGVTIARKGLELTTRGLAF